MKIVKVFFISFFLASYSFAECDWKTISEQNGKYVYNLDCHLKVGDLVKDDKKKDEAIKELKTAIEMKDLALNKADERVMLWRNETYNQNEALDKVYRSNKYVNLGYLGAGIVGTILAILVGGQLQRK